ncbi:MAG: hypothetical protein Q8O42_15710 [Acidobacteriota bacterium]|nr:hypothetical protein [Acidobacteriota bacterium]
MAKTGDAPDRKAKSKPRARAARPSFAPAAAPAANAAWVYRSDAPAKVVAKPAAKPVAARPAPRRHARTPIAPVPEARSSRVIHALDVVTLPIAVSLMAVLAPMRRLLGPSRH